MLRLLLCCIAVLAAGEPPALRERIAGEDGTTYALFAPSVRLGPDERLPLLICHHPGGDAAQEARRWTAWGERWGVAVLGIDGPHNDMGHVEKQRLQDAVLRSVAAGGLRLHPTLRLTVGVSGGSADGARLIRRRPAEFAGACLIATYAQLGSVRQPGIAGGVVHGGKDAISPSTRVLSGFLSPLHASGMPLRWTFTQLGGHTSGPPGAAEDTLTWLLWTARLGPHHASATEAVRHQAEAAAWAGALAAGKIPASQRRRELSVFVHLPTGASVAGHAAVARAWAAEVASQAGSAAGERLGAWQEAMRGELWTAVDAKLGSGWIVTGHGDAATGSEPVLPAALRQEILAGMARLANDAAAAREAGHRAWLRAAVRAEIDAGADAAALATVAATYAALAAAAPASRWGRDAAAQAARLDGRR